MCLTHVNIVFAVDACVENDVVPVILDASVGESSYVPTYSPNNKYNWNYTTHKWSVNNSYGTVIGTYACLTSNCDTEGLEICTANNGVLTDNGVEVVGGEHNGYYCWCKIIYPVVSLWLYQGAHTSGYTGSPLSDCINNCILDCGGTGAGITNRVLYRTRLLESVQN